MPPIYKMFNHNVDLALRYNLCFALAVDISIKSMSKSRSREQLRVAVEESRLYTFVLRREP
jgi:hypothetical protein